MILSSSHPPDSQLQVGLYKSLVRCTGSRIPLRISRSRLKSIGFNIQPSIPSAIISSRCRSKSEAETANIGMRPLSFFDRRTGVSGGVGSFATSISNTRIAFAASKPFNRGILSKISAEQDRCKTMQSVVISLDIHQNAVKFPVGLYCFKTLLPICGTHNCMPI